MLKLEDFKIKEIETLDSIKGGQDCLYMTHEYVNFLGWIIETDSHGDISRDQYLSRAKFSINYLYNKFLFVGRGNLF